MARSASRPPFGQPKVAVGPNFALVLQEGRKNASIHASKGVIWGIPDKCWQADYASHSTVALLGKAAAALVAA